MRMIEKHTVYWTLKDIKLRSINKVWLGWPIDIN